MAKDEHTCNSALQSTHDNAIGSTSDGKGIIYQKEKSSWCSICGGNNQTQILGTWEAR